MNVVIVGGGTVGYHLTKALLARGHEVTVIEPNEDRCRLLMEGCGKVVVRGECDVALLREAGTARANVLIAVADQDETNLIACLLARRILKVPRVIARVVDPKNRTTFKELGINLTVSSTDIICNLIEQEAITTEIIPLLALAKGDLEIVELVLPPDSPVLSVSLKDLPLPADSVLISIIRGDQTVFPRGSTTFRPNDTILALTSTKGVEQLKRVFYR
ncbi:MAG: K+ transport system, NAD-binding component [candidate division NC10 bacterium CSP1-5]|nr:MAG: K+ transport system, NAD-binding component [candidate division NC10 bacterium CSP1-5]